MVEAFLIEKFLLSIPELALKFPIDTMYEYAKTWLSFTLVTVWFKNIFKSSFQLFFSNSSNSSSFFSQIVRRYYKIHLEPRKPKLSSAAFGRFRLEVQDEKILASKTTQDVAATPVSESSFQRSPSISASLCDSEKLANVAATAIVEVNIPHEEALRSVEKWVYNLLKFAFSGPHKNKSGIIAKDWIAGLNEQAKKISAISGSKKNSRSFVFKSVNEKSRTPKLTKLRAEVAPNGRIFLLEKTHFCECHVIGFKYIVPCIVPTKIAKVLKKTLYSRWDIWTMTS